MPLYPEWKKAVLIVISPPSEAKGWFYFLHHSLLPISPGGIDTQRVCSIKHDFFVKKCENLNDNCIVICQCRTNLCIILKSEQHKFFYIFYLKIYFYQMWSKIQFKILSFGLFRTFYCEYLSQIMSNFYKNFRRSSWGYPKMTQIKDKQIKQTNK